VGFAGDSGDISTYHWAQVPPPALYSKSCVLISVFLGELFVGYFTVDEEISRIKE